MDRSRLVRRRWQILRGQTKPELHAVDCRDRRDRRTITAWLAGEVRGILTLAAAPRNPESDRAVRAGLSVGLPVMLWPRTRCTDDHGDGGSCAGDRFLDVLRHALESTAPPDLPERVRDLRVAAHAARNDLARCRAVTLFWHDPDMTPREPHPLVLGSAKRDDA